MHPKRLFMLEELEDLTYCVLLRLELLPWPLEPPPPPSSPMKTTIKVMKATHTNDGKFKAREQLEINKFFVENAEKPTIITTIERFKLL